MSKARNGKVDSYLLVTVVCLVVIVASGVHLFRYEASRKGSSGEHQVLPANVIPEVTAQAILREYSDNEVRADQQFKGRPWVVTGIIESIGKDLIGRPYLILTSDGAAAYPAIQAVFQRDATDAIAQLHKRYSVRVTCTCEGKTMHVQFSDCAF